MREVDFFKSLLKDDVVNLNAILIKNYQKLDINEKDVIFLFYLSNHDIKGDNNFYPSVFKEEAKLSIEDIYKSIENLTNKGLLEITASKNSENNKTIERFSINKFYKRIVDLYSATKEYKNDNEENFYALIGSLYEELFHKQMSALDADIVRCWGEEKKFSFDEIKAEMLDMAKMGKTSLKSVDQSLIKKRIIKEQSPEYIETNKIIDQLKTKWKK